MTATTKVKPFYEVVPDGKGGNKLRINVHDGQIDILDASDDPTIKHIVASCGTQSGKTCLGSVWTDRRIDQWLEHGDTTEQGDFLAISATYKLMTRKMLPQMRLYFTTFAGKADHKKIDSCFESREKLRGGPLWVIFLGSADNPDSLESATAKSCWSDEPGQKSFKREAMEATTRRLSISRGLHLYTTTPYVYGWFKREVYDRALRKEPGYVMVNFKSTMNPAFPPEEYTEQKSKLPAWKFRMFYDGVFERPAGQVYDCWDKQQEIPRFEIPLHWPRYSGHDFGPIHTAALFYAVEPETGSIFLYRAIKSESKKSTHENVVKWRSEMHKDEAGVIDERIMLRVGGALGESGWRDAYASEGWPILEPKITGPGSVELQIDRVYAMNKLRKVFVFSDLYDYLDEKESFSRELDDNYEPTDKLEDEATFHYMAAERYILSYFEPDTAQVPNTEVWQY